MDRNRRFTELVGICWHEFDWDSANNKYYCMKCRAWLYDFKGSANPNFASDPRLVLEVMRTSKDWPGFIKFILDKIKITRLPSTLDYCMYLCDLMIDTTGLLRDKAIEFMEGRK